MKKIVDNAIFTVTSEIGVNEYTIGSIVNHSDSDLQFTVELKDNESNICADIKLAVAAKSSKHLSPSYLTTTILEAFEDGNYSFTGDNLIVAVERPPEATDFSFYFDDDGMKSVGGENCAVYIFNGYSAEDVRYNKEEFDSLYDKAVSLEEDVLVLIGVDDRYSNFPYATDRECLEHYGIAYTEENSRRLIAWAKSFDDTDDVKLMAEYLSITTGKPWKTRSFTGYSQGDHCTVLYCSENYSEESVTEIGKLWLGCGSEYEIDGENGYYVIDDIQWGDRENLRKTLADYYGCEPRNLVIREYVDTVQRYIYKNV